MLQLASNSVPLLDNPCELIHSQTQLKVLPAAVPELLSALNDNDIGFVELSKTISKFPAIAARLLFLSNSSWAAPVSEITSVEMACAKLGLSVVKSVSIALAIAAPFDPARCPAFRTEEFWATALLVADAAAWLAEVSSEIDEDKIATVHTSALLHNLGLLWMADTLPNKTNTAFEQAATQPDLCVAQALQNHCGADYCAIGGCLAEAWALPGPILVAMKHHLDFNYSDTNWQIAAITGYAASMVHALDHSIETLPEDLRLERLGIKAEPRDEVYERLESRYEKVREMVKVLFC